MQCQKFTYKLNLKYYNMKTIFFCLSNSLFILTFVTVAVYNKPNDVRWFKKDANSSKQEPDLRSADPIGLKQINSTYDLHITAEGNGTYVCEIFDTVSESNVRGEIDVIAYAPPKIVSFNAIPINTTEIYISWVVHAYNSEIESYMLATRKADNVEWKYYFDEKIHPQNNSFVIRGLNKSTEYQVKLEVKTKNWTTTGVWEDKNQVKTLDKEPVFVPNISIKGFSATSVTIGWPPPPDDIANLIQYYLLEARKKNARQNDTSKAFHPRDPKNLPYMFGTLEPHSTYVFRVSVKLIIKYLKKNN